jgi:5-methylthioadenosine/S-adenosylhomocysteine deaminase
MYWYGEAVIEAAREMGLRAVVGPLIIDFDKKRGRIENFKKIYQKLKLKLREVGSLSISVAPHSIYGVSKENLIWAKDFAKKENLLLHIHLSETEEEVNGCLKLAKLRPVEYLEKIGFLNGNCILAHSIWLNEKEIEISAKRKCSVVYNPCSNMKLASGIFPYKKLKEAGVNPHHQIFGVGVNICLGTDGPASNNSLDMFLEMKFASLLQKVKEMDPTIAPAKEIFEIATKNGAKALKINAGEIKEGKLADLILIDLNQISLIPGHNLVSDIVYSASGNCVSDLICNGKILMRDRKIEGEEKIKKEATKRAKNLTK